MGLAADALWVKRDDLSGLGGGGNKVRKLQYTCAQALAAGATTVITSGAPQSNHARLTAAAAARLGLRSVLVLRGEEPEVPAGNLVLDLLAGARLAWTGPATAEQTRREVERQAEKVRQDGGIPHVIPYGGSNSYAAQAYVDCSGELLAQLARPLSGEGASRPRALARATVSARRCVPSLAYRWRMWVLTVLCEMYSSFAISGIDRSVGR